MDPVGVTAARRTLDVVEELAGLLNTGLSRNELSILLALIENGCNSEALAQIVKYLRQQATEVQAKLEQRVHAQ